MTTRTIKTRAARTIAAHYVPTLASLPSRHRAHPVVTVRCHLASGFAASQAVRAQT
jgi:hypothetical protein